MNVTWVTPLGDEYGLDDTATYGGPPKSFRALVEAAAIAERYRETVVHTSPPRLLQRILFPPLARLARRRAG